MFIIKTKQITELEQIARNDFLKRMTESICREFEIELSANKNIKIEVKNAIAEAEIYGFEYEEDIEDYLIIKWRRPDMRYKINSSEILKILTFPGRNAKRKISLLESLSY